MKNLIFVLTIFSLSLYPSNGNDNDSGNDNDNCQKRAITNSIPIRIIDKEEEKREIEKKQIAIMQEFNRREKIRAHQEKLIDDLKTTMRINCECCLCLCITCCIGYPAYLNHK